jgi:hypothetical protein
MEFGTVIVSTGAQSKEILRAKSLRANIQHAILRIFHQR